jgi:endonuclease/exonuclease/phosphatase family metal-dependent hydrolase
MSLLKQESGVMPGKCFKERLQLFAEYVKDNAIDVVMVQELFVFRIGPFYTSSNFAVFAEAMRACGLTECSDPRLSMHAKVLGQNSGVAIFSKWPLLNPRSFDFESTGERMNSKGFVCADIAMARNRTAHLVSAHLDARAFLHKEKQILQISDHLMAEQQAAHAVIREKQLEFVVCGDWNLCPEVASEGGYGDGGEFRFLCETMAASGLEGLWRAGEVDGTHNRATLDHIFLRRAAWADVDGNKEVVKKTDKDGLKISDHLGLKVMLAPMI